MAIQKVLIVTRVGAGWGHVELSPVELLGKAKELGWKMLPEIPGKRFPLLPRFDGAFGPYWQGAGMARYDSWEVHELLSMD